MFFNSENEFDLKAFLFTYDIYVMSRKEDDAKAACLFA